MKRFSDTAMITGSELRDQWIIDAEVVIDHEIWERLKVSGLGRIVLAPAFHQLLSLSVESPH